MSERLAVVIPTCNRTSADIRIGYVLQALAFGEPSSHFDALDITIWDEGDVPVTMDRWVRLIFDLLTARGHCLRYLRRAPSHGVAAARRGLLTEAPDTGGPILMLDDDLLPMPDAVDCLLEVFHAHPGLGFVQGVKVELDRSRVYHNDINKLTVGDEEADPIPLYFGDAAFLLVSREGLSQVQWDVVTRFEQQELAGEDVAITLMIADKMPCLGVPSAVGYHLSLQRPRWRWEASSDALQVEILRGVVSERTLRAALPYLGEKPGTSQEEATESE